MSKYICPRCQGRLLLGVAQQFCPHCCQTYPLDQHGITTFGRQTFWGHSLTPAQMEQLVNAAAHKGWQIALRHHLQQLTNTQTYQQALSEKAADWHFLLNMPPQTRILEIGCDWGQITTPLARHYDEVHTLDANLLTLQFVYWRTQQEGLHNLSFAQNDPLEWSTLPYPDQFFNLVVLNDTLAWIGAARTEATPSEYQAKALQEIHRVLRPGGTLYLRAKNRYAYNNFWGHKSENGVPFVSLLPRSWANKLSRYWGKKEGYRHYTYSLAGYRQLLANNGLSLKQVYAEYPDGRHPQGMIPIRLPQAAVTRTKTALSNGIGQRLRWLIHSRVWPWFVPSYGLVAQRGEKSHAGINLRGCPDPGTDRGRAARAPSIAEGR